VRGVIVWTVAAGLILMATGCATHGARLLQPAGDAEEAAGIQARRAIEEASNSVTVDGVRIAFPAGWAVTIPRVLDDSSVLARIQSRDATVQGWIEQISVPFEVDPDKAAARYSAMLPDEAATDVTETSVAGAPARVITYRQSNGWGVAVLRAHTDWLWVIHLSGTAEFDTVRPIVSEIVRTFEIRPPSESERSYGQFVFFSPDGRWRWLSDLESGFLFAGTIAGEAVTVALERDQGSVALEEPEQESSPYTLPVNNVSQSLFESSVIPEDVATLSVRFAHAGKSYSLTIRRAVPESDRLTASEIVTSRELRELFRYMLIFPD